MRFDFGEFIEPYIPSIPPNALWLLVMIVLYAISLVLLPFRFLSCIKFRDDECDV